MRIESIHRESTCVCVRVCVTNCVRKIEITTYTSQNSLGKEKRSNSTSFILSKSKSIRTPAPTLMFRRPVVIVTVSTTSEYWDSRSHSCRTWTVSSSLKSASVKCVPLQFRGQGVLSDCFEELKSLQGIKTFHANLSELDRGLREHVLSEYNTPSFRKDIVLRSTFITPL